MKKFNVIVGIMCEGVEAETPREARIKAIHMLQHPERTQVEKALEIHPPTFDICPIVGGKYLFETVIKKPGLTVEEKRAIKRDLRRAKKREMKK